MPAHETITVAGHSVTLKRHARAKRLTLRVSPKGPVLTVPKRMRLATATDFLTRHMDWLQDRLADAPKRVTVDLGTDLPFAGQTLSVVRAADGRTRIEGDHLLVPDSRSGTTAAVRSFLIAQARQDLTAASTDYARQIDRNVGRITLRDTRSRWGSCTARGDLNFSWRLIMAPAEVLDYVAAHEVAHLAQMNHSAKFWGIVADLCPDYHVYRTWLRTHGPDLHRYDFGT